MKRFGVYDGLASSSLSELLAQLESRSLSARELVEACLDRADKIEPHLRAFVALTPELAVDAAKDADRRRARGRPVGTLAGVPIAIKDLFFTRGIPTTACSDALLNFDPGVDAGLWERLQRAGAGLLGKTTTHEFGLGTASYPTRNPWDLSRTPGGSSGGSGAAVAACMVPAAIGSDTGGSLRIPAAACGVSSVRPTPGRTSNYGLLPRAPSFDTSGPMARRMIDISILMSVLAGYDARDPLSSDTPVPDFPRVAPSNLDSVRIGVPEFLWEYIDSEYETACREALNVFVRMGAKLTKVAAPPASSALRDPKWTCYETIACFEGLRIHRMWQEKWKYYSSQALARVKAGEGVTESEYQVAKLDCRKWSWEWRRLLKEQRVDFVVHPTIGEPPPAVDVQPPVGPSMRLTLPWTLAGFPTVSVPVAIDSRGLPVGLSVSGLPEREVGVIGLGIAVDEEVALWKQSPDPALPSVFETSPVD